MVVTAVMLISGSKAQNPIYNMSNLTVTDCKGTLLDSEAGASGTTYANNENFVFTINTGGTITMTFVGTFEVDSGFDFLKIHNGPDTNSPLLATYTGTTLPPAVVANSGFMTVHFTSDGSAAYSGWTADWTSTVIPPTPPVMSINPVPTCSTSTISVTFTDKVLCDSLLPSDFSISGPMSLSVNSVSSVNCSSAGDSSTTFLLGLNQELTENCWYTIDLDLGIPDNCDSIWHFFLTDSFLVYTCPFDVDIQSTYDTICPGLCTDIEAIISGSGTNCLTYNYTWNPTQPNSPGPFTVCPSSNTTYSVNVQYTGGGPIANDSKEIVFINPEITDSDTTVCETDSSFTLNVTMTGGQFSGPGIVNPITGIFSPFAAGPGNHYVKYGFTNFCEDSILITVKPGYAGLDEAACPGTAPFLVSGFTPSGGVWTGDSITSSGIFNPAQSGTYVLTYTYNGCIDTKTITVDSITLYTPIDTVCESDDTILIVIDPPGGRWSGPGITDSLTGDFVPEIAGPGSKTLTYSLSGGGCSFSIDVFVKEIDARYNQLFCPHQGQFTLNPPADPSGGTWTGLGIINGSSGLYDPFVPFTGNNGNDTLTYTASNGCTDTRVIYIRDTRVYVDTLEHCIGDTSMLLEWTTVQRTPCCGIWTGNGIVQGSGSDYFFNPQLAGVGVHKLLYERNTCVDSVVMIVYPDTILFPDTTVCSTHEKWFMPTMPIRGTWTGNGIIDAVTGEFDPSVAGSGTHNIRYITSNNCVDDTVKVTVYPFVPAQIGGLDSVYCYYDSAYPPVLQPSGGELTGSGLDSNLHFNPVVGGEGIHQLYYTFGVGQCQTDDSMSIQVTTPIETSVDVVVPEICAGESATITISATGGHPDSLYNYQWSDGLFPIAENTVSPVVTTTYYIQTLDGCSEPSFDSVTVTVGEIFDADFETSEQLCFGQDGYIIAMVNGTSIYNYEWNTSPVVTDSVLEGKAGSSYGITIWDRITGCSYDTIVKIPSYKNVSANFVLSPNLDCIPSNLKEVTIIDLSQNADSGTWFFGEDEIPYELGVNPVYSYETSGLYDIRLEIFNEGGCSDEHSTEVCVEDIRPVFVADAFTPNGDGVNDVLHAKGKGFKEFSFVIFDRWGNKVFESNDENVGWDGRYKGKPAVSGVYIYLVTVKLIDNNTQTVKGDFTLIR